MGSGKAVELQTGVSIIKETDQARLGCLYVSSRGVYVAGRSIMRKTIYVKDSAIWDRIKLESKKRGISVSELLLEGWGSVGQLDRIEKKVDALVGRVFDLPEGIELDTGEVKSGENPINVFIREGDTWTKGVLGKVEYPENHIDLLSKELSTSSPKKSDPAGAKQDVIDSLKAKVAKIPGKKSDPYFRPMEKKGSKKGGKK